MAEAQTQAAAPADAVSIIQGMLERESAPQEQQAQETQEVEVTQEDSQPETEESDAQPNQQVEGEDAPAEAKVAEIPLDQLEAIQLEVEVSGDSGKVVEKPTIKELKLGYMRQKDYQTKTAEVARQRNEVGEKIRQGIEGERQAYAQTLQQLQSAMVQLAAPELQNVDWNKLATDNPADYVAKRNRLEQFQNAIRAINEKQHEVTAKMQAEQSQALQNAAKEARETLERDIPGWNDELYQSLMKTGSDYGFKPEEVGSWVDPRSIKVLHDAYQFRQLKVKPVQANKVVNVPKVIKPGTVNSSTVKQRNVEASMKKLQTSGRVEDAAAVIRARLG